MKPVRLLFDEHMDPAFGRALSRRAPGADILRVGDEGAPPLGSSDPELLIWCEQQGFTLVTMDRATMPVHIREHLARGHHTAGVFIVGPNGSFRVCLDELALILAASSANDWRDALRYIPFLT